MATTPNLGITLLETTSGQPEVLVNSGLKVLDEVSPINSKLYARRDAGVTGLTWAYYGGTHVIDGAVRTIANGTVTLTASNTNYVEATRAGVVSANVSGFTADRIPIREIVAGATTITSEIDRRPWVVSPIVDILNRVIASDADITLTQYEASADVLQFTSSVTLTAQRTVTLPGYRKEWEVYNNTTGNRSLLFKAAAGSGILVPVNQRTKIYYNGSDFNYSINAGTYQDIAYAASITPNFPSGATIVVGPLTGNITVNAITNPVKGGKATFTFAQDATGGRTITWNSVFKKAADGAGTANQKAATSFTYDGTDWIQDSSPLTWF